jgi:hypothetical protein
VADWSSANPSGLVGVEAEDGSDMFSVRMWETALRLMPKVALQLTSKLDLQAMLKVPLRLTSPRLLEASGDVEASLYLPYLLGSRFVLLVSSRFALRPAACAKSNMRYACARQDRLGNRLLPWTSLVSAQPRQLEQHFLPFRLDRSQGFAPQG